MTAALIICVGALISAWAFMVPGDQLAAAALGGGLVGLGVTLLRDEVTR